jgi:flagellar hook assembly protein FlgD
MPFRLILIAAFAAVLVPASASAEVRLVTRDEPVPSAARAGSAITARSAPLRFNLIGLHWRGPGQVWFRTAREPGVWSGWHNARPEEEDLPDPGTDEATASAGWKIGNPFWTGPARLIQYRFSGRVERLRAHFLWSEPTKSARSVARATAPAIIRRAAWGANESIVRDAPSYAAAVRFAVVHHTAGTNSYSGSDSAAIVRGIQRYHVLANGWDDIGYNFLIDKYGRVFEGRAGGIDRNVIGAHAQGFNTGSTGVAILGTYESGGAPRGARSALVKLLSWRLDVAHADPLARMTWKSLGNPRYPAGTAVRLRAVSGHRDTGPTSCPGSGLYAQLNRIASAAAARGLPKLYDPKVSGRLGGPVRFTARLSASLPWSVTILDAGGSRVAAGSGTGIKVDWSWNASSVSAGSYGYRIEAGPDVRVAEGAVPGPPLLEISEARVAPAVVTPNGDRVGDTTTVSFSLTIRAFVTVKVLDSSGSAVRTLVSARAFGSGKASVRWNGTRADGSAMPDGRYRVLIEAESPGQEVSRTRALLVDRTLGHFELDPPAFSPNGDGRLDAVTLGFALTRAADVRVRIMAGAREVARVKSSSLDAGTASFVWDGRNASTPVVDGTYTAAVDATTALGTRRLRLPVTLDTVRPRVRVLSAVRRAGVARLRLSLTEAADLWVRFGDHTVKVRREAGTANVWYRTSVSWASVVAWDAAANRSRRVFARFG